MSSSLPELGQLILGSHIAAVGILALVISLLGRRRTDPMLASFGAFALLWGVRLCFRTPLVWDLGVGRLTSAWVDATITYLINVPAWLFFSRLVGRGWRSTIYWGVRVMAVFAAVGIASDLVQLRPATLGTLNNLLVIAGIAALLAALWEARGRSTRDLRLAAVGLAAFGLSALNDNLEGIGLLPWGQRLETIGFVFFIGCLGVIAARRFFVRETRLAALEIELETAREIQLSLLPRRLPTAGEVAVAARFRPASRVAGDLYDVSEPGGRGVGVVVADVSGHGIPAALIASMVKIAVATQAESFDRPARLLGNVNQELCGSFQRGFVTATYAWLDRTGGRLTVANAGHPAPLLRRAADGSVHEAGGQGAILGRFADAGYSEQELSLEPGDRLLFYTDGVTEARSPQGEQFGEERLRSFVGGAEHGHPEAFCDALLAELRRWSAAGAELSLEDDVTLVVVDFRGA